MTTPRRKGFKADSGLSYATIEKFGKYIRKFFTPALDATDPFPAFHVFETLDRYYLPTKGGYSQLGYGVKDLVKLVGPGVEARTVYDSRRGRIIVELSEEVYEAAEMGDGRARFSIAHELGHVFLHHDLVKRLSQIPHHEVAALMRGGPSLAHKDYEDTEWQADACAGAILMPASGLSRLETKTGTLALDAIRDTFDVSMVAASKRRSVFFDKRFDLLK